MRGVKRVLSAPLQGAQLLKNAGGRSARLRVSVVVAQEKPGHDSGEMMLGDAEKVHTHIRRAWLTWAASIMASAVKASEARKTKFNVFGVFAKCGVTGIQAGCLPASRCPVCSVLFFYGLLIVFFLFSSSWAAPLTLTRGHELVSKTQAELSQLKIVP